jgi:ABC-type amino acid transport substrate-binding protein
MRRLIDRIGARRLVLALVGLILMALLFRTWRQSRPLNDGTWDRVQKSGVLRVGMDASYPPFSDTPGGGAPVGLDVDLINEIGRRLNVRVEFTNMGYDGLYDSLYTGQVDALISALSIDPAQLGRVSYTRSYIDAGQVLVSRSGEYESMNALDGKAVAVEYGSIGDEIARNWRRRLHVLNIVHFTTSDEALKAAEDGGADVALLDQITARLYLKKHTHSTLKISPRVIYGDVYAVAVRQVSIDLGDAISKTLDTMESDGTLEAIINRWL